MKGPSLSVVIVTKNSGRYIERLLKQAKKLYADELITLVDEASTDNTYALCKKYADHVEKIAVPGYVEPVLQEACDLATCTHILRLDDDELVGSKFVAMKQDILQTREPAIYLPRYAIVGHDHTHYLANAPWYPDLQLRLFRKGAVIHQSTIHHSPHCIGETGQLYDQDKDEGVHIFHMKFVYKSRAEREAIAARYESISPGSATRPEYAPHQLPENFVRNIQPCKETIAEPNVYATDDMPEQLIIETCSKCNGRCITCPRHKIERDALMPMDTFMRIIDQAEGVKEIYLSEYGEPLMDTHLIERIHYIKTHLDAKVGFFTNGSLLSEGKAKALLEGGLDFIVFSLDAATKETFEYIRQGLSFEDVQTNIQRFITLNNSLGHPCKVRFHSVKRPENKDERAFITRVFGKPDEHSVTDCEDRNGELFKNNATPGPCYSPFRTMHIHTDGTVVMCCQDYDGREPMGDIADGLREVWKNARYKKYRRLHNDWRKHEIPLCAKCHTTY